MLKNLNRCDFYIFLQVLYNLAGLLYSPGIINQLLQLFILLWVMVECINVFRLKTHSPILKSLKLLVIMYCFYGVFYILFGDDVIISKTG